MPLPQVCSLRAACLQPLLLSSKQGAAGGILPCCPATPSGPPLACLPCLPAAPAAVLRICANGTHPAPSGAKLGRLRRRSVFVPLGQFQEGGGTLPQTLVVVHR